MSIPTDRHTFIFRAILGYVLFTGLWVLVSDALLISLANPSSIIWLSLSKGLLLVLITSLLLYFILQAVPERSPAEANPSPNGGWFIQAIAAPDTHWPRWLAYLFAVVISLLTLLLRLSLEPQFGNHPSLVLFMQPIVLSALLGGLGPGLLATVLCVLGADYFVIPPRYSFAIAQPQTLFYWGVMIVNGVLISLLSEALHRSRRWIESALRQRTALQEQLTLALEGSDIGLWDWWVQTGVLEINARWAGIVGYTLEELQPISPQTWEDLCHPEDLARSNALLERHFRGEIPTYECEARLRHKAGHWVWILDRGKVVAWEAPGKPARMTGTHLDITERKHAEAELAQHRAHLEALVAHRTAELQAAEEQAQLILSSSADGIYGIDTEGRITFINPAGCALLGSTAEALLGHPVHACIHHTYPDGRSHPEAECPILAALHSGAAVRANHEIFWRADGRPVPVAYATQPIVKNGQIIGAVVSFTDISAQREAETAREAARQETERLAQIKSAFLANMSHEIRTPLNAVLGFAQIGLRESTGRKSQGTFRHILDAGQLLLGIVNDVLDFSKIEAGKLGISHGVILLHEVISQAADMIKLRACNKGITFEVQQTHDLPATCRGDSLRLTQVLVNLLSNAVKFTEQGHITLAIHPTPTELIFQVIDSGIGMSAEEVSRLFQPFEQADSSITRKFGGTGLGLVISKHLVMLMGGSIRVQSQPGQGSTFEVRLPLIDPEGLAAQREEAVPVTASPVSGQPRLQGLTLLVAEDNEVNLLLLEDALSREGCQLSLAKNGRLAVERARETHTPIDIVLMDVQMPEMDGYEATRRIHEFAPTLPIIGLTAHAMPEEREQCLTAGMVEHVAKPVDLDQLVAAILKHVRGSEPPAAVPMVRPETPLTQPVAETLTIDWPALTAQYQDRPEFLVRILNTITASNAERPERLRAAAAQLNYKELAFITHSLKGMAGNILPAGFQALARQIEASARARDAEAGPQALRLADALEALLEEITAYLAVQAPPAENPAKLIPADSPQVAEAIARLETLLATDDTAVNAWLGQTRALLRQALGDAADRLDAQIAAYDYENALTTLRTAWKPRT